MLSRTALAIVVLVAAGSATAADMFPNYWDRYAVSMSNELVPTDSETSSFYRNQYAVMARGEAAATAARDSDDLHAQDNPATRSGAGAVAGCPCPTCHHK